MSEPTQVKITTIGGALTILFANITNNDIIKTILLTTIGGVVSFIISLLLKATLKWWRSRKV